MKNEGKRCRPADFHCNGRGRLVCPQITGSDGVGSTLLPSAVRMLTESIFENDSGTLHSNPRWNEVTPISSSSGRGRSATAIPASTPLIWIRTVGGCDWHES